VKLNMKQVLLYLIIAFVIVSIWKDPSGSSKTAGTFLGMVGSFFVDLVNKISDFVKGLSN